MSPEEEAPMQQLEGNVKRYRSRITELKEALKYIEFMGEAGSCPGCAGKPHMPHCLVKAALRSNADGDV